MVLGGVDDHGGARRLAPQMAAELAHEPLAVEVDVLADERRPPAVRACRPRGWRPPALAEQGDLRREAEL
jgi:hypothetical protein